MTPARLRDAISEECHSYYYAIWATLSCEQRRTLYYLAEDDFVSANNPEIVRLLRMGLVFLDPKLRVMNESFRRFVIRASVPDEIAAWTQSRVESPWQALKLPLFFVLVSVVAFLFLTQKDVYETTLAFVTALSAGVPMLFKLFDVLNKNPQLPRAV